MTALLGLILCYLAFLTWYGLKGGLRRETLVQFLTTGGKTGVVLCALSLVSTIVGGSATLGIGGLAQKTGAAAFWWLGVGAIGLLIHGWLIAPKIRALPCVTLPEVAGYVAGKTAERWSGGIIAASWVAVAAAQFVALHTLLLTLASPTLAECLYVMIAGAVLVHTLTGGQRAVIRTDAVQTVLLLGGFAVTAFWLCFFRPDDAAGVQWELFNEHFDWVDWVKMLLLVGITYVIGPDMFSRSFSARNGRTARCAAWIAAPMLVLFGVAITFVALMNLEASQPIAAWLSESSGLPWGLRAALALGLVSALCGSADTVLLSACGIAERNLLGGDSTRTVRFLVAAVGGLAASAVYFSGDIISLLITAYSFFVPGVAVPLLMALLGDVRPVKTSLWLSGAILGGFGGLAGNLTGNQTWTFAGILISASLALLSRYFGKQEAASFCSEKL